MPPPGRMNWLRSALTLKSRVGEFPVVELREKVGQADAAIVAMQRLVAQPRPYRFAVKPYVAPVKEKPVERPPQQQVDVGPPPGPLPPSLEPPRPR